MEDLIKKGSLFILVFAGLLLLLFFLIDLGLFGEGVKIGGFYYVFMLAFLIPSFWAYRNSDRFKGF